MKIVIVLPDDLFRAAEDTARQLGISRGKLYARALECFLTREEESVTAQLNEVYIKVPAEIDPILMRMQFDSLPRASW